MLRIASVSYVRNTNLGRMTNFSDTVLKCPVVFLTALDRSKTVPPLVVASWETRYTAPRSCVGAQSLGDEPSLSKHRDDLRMQHVRRRGRRRPVFFRLVFTFGLVSFSLEIPTDGSGGNGICTKVGCETMIWMFVKDMRPLRLYVLLISDSIVKVILNSLLPNEIKLEGGVEMMSTESLIKLKCKAGNNDS